MPSLLPPGTTHQTWRKGRTAHLLAAGDHTTRWSTLNRLGSRDCQSLSEFGLRSGCTQQGLMLRKTEPARRRLLRLLSSCFSAPPQSWPVQDPRPVKQSGHSLGWDTTESQAAAQVIFASCPDRTRDYKPVTQAQLSLMHE